MNWRDLYKQRSLWQSIMRRRIEAGRVTAEQRRYAKMIPWRYWWN